MQTWMRATLSSWTEASIRTTRGIDPYNGCKAVCFIDGEYTVKRVEIHEDGAILLPCNEKNTKYKPIPVGPDNDFLIWGVVTWVIKKV